MRLTFLSGVEARRGEQPLLLGPPQRKAVLCALAFRRRQWVSAQSLLSALYEESAPASGVGVIQTHVAGLRRVLEPERRPRTPPSVLLYAHGGYQLRIEDERIDVCEFDRLVAEGERARDRSEWEAAERLYAGALRLYSGEPLAGVPGPYAAMWRTTLTERRLAALEGSLDIAVTRGRADSVIDRLRVLTAEHPLRERPRALLMRALHLVGRQSDALDVYARTRRILADELGVEPGGELRTLHGQILSGALPGTREQTSLAAVTTPAPTAVQPVSRRPSGEAPSEAAPLVEREDQLATVMALAARATSGEGGLAVVSGIYGHGKSRFLDEVARLVPGARRVGLSRTPSADSVPYGLLDAILSGLGLDLGVGPVPVPSVGGQESTADQTGTTDRQLADRVAGLLADSAAGAPLVLLVDDVTSADECSMRVLALLARRLRTTHVLMVLGLEDRPWDPEVCRRALVLGNAASAALYVGRLSESAIAELAAPRVGTRHVQEFAKSIHQATAGIPMLVTALIADLCTLPDLDPGHVPAHPPDVRYTRALALILDNYTEDRSLLLRAIAVLHECQPTPDVLAAVCQESVATIRDRCERFATSSVLAVADPPTFRHPLILNALRWLCSPQEHTRLRVAAAQHALCGGHSTRQTARYLDDLTGTQWSDWTAVLVDAADECLRHNAVQEALRHLQAALRIAGPDRRDAVLVQLGQLELWVNPAASQAHLQLALKGQRATEAVPTALIPLAWTMASNRQSRAALALMDEVIAETERRDPVAAATVRASSWMVAALTHEGWAAFVRRLRAERAAGEGPGDLVTTAVLTWDDAFGVRCSAAEALSRFPTECNKGGEWGRLPREVVGILTHIAKWAGQFTLAGQLSDLDEDHYFGTLDIYRRIMRAEVHMRRGDYRQALDTCAPMADLPLEQVPRRPPALVAQYAQALLGLGRVDEADQWLDSVTEHANPETWEWTVVKWVRALVCAARGQARQAAAYFLDCGRRNAAWGLDNPGYLAWRSSAALQLLTAGEGERARELAVAELAVARRWDTPVVVGRALRAVALTSAGGTDLPLLEQAVDHLRRGEALTELVPALIDLARARADAGDRKRARELLLEARELSEPRGLALFTAEVGTCLEELSGAE
ncbi:BTAD domain-containing putative transcriptional regulator [Streptomyces sp. NPDC050504]|uniref:BTAD domain-containing putative transcriptional regulator n=1 Tax=Streptomyces sp. NPDC050504 TaxID=3365618 RepID=UPI0037AB6870